MQLPLVHLAITAFSEYVGHMPAVGGGRQLVETAATVCKSGLGEVASLSTSQVCNSINPTVSRRLYFLEVSLLIIYRHPLLLAFIKSSLQGSSVVV